MRASKLTGRICQRRCIVPKVENSCPPFPVASTAALRALPTSSQSLDTIRHACTVRGGRVADEGAARISWGRQQERYALENTGHFGVSTRLQHSCGGQRRCLSSQKAKEEGAEGQHAEGDQKEGSGDGSGNGPEEEAEKLSWTQIVLLGSVAVVFFGGLFFTINELMPSKLSPNTVFSKAFDAVQADADVANHFGTPLTAHGREHGGHREGRRNFIEHTEYVAQEDGSKRTRIRFHLKGPYAHGLVYAEVSSKLASDQFVYLQVQDVRTGHVICLQDRRSEILSMARAGSDEEKSAISKLLGGGSWGK